jgi:O-antigen ligase
MLHFNRTACLMLVAAMTMLAAFFARGLKRAPRAACLALAVLAFALTIETFTRGAIVAIVAAVALLGCLLSRRILIVLAGAGVLFLLLLPAGQRDYLLSPLHYSTYQPNDRMTSMKERQMAWSWGLEQVRRHPLTGLGFGPKIIRRAYNDDARRTGNPWVLENIKSGADLQHLHNTPLEIAAESGLPALFAFAAFTLLRWWLLLGAWRAARGPGRAQAAAWIAFELAIVVFSMLFYMLKLNAGYVIWYVWAYILSASEAALRGPAPTPAAAEAPARERAS